MSICECIYNAACQVPLGFDDTMTLINYIKQNVQVSNSTTDQSKEALQQQLAKPQMIPDDHMFLIMALLYCFDYRTVETGE